MSKPTKYILIILLLGLIGLQFFSGKAPEVRMENPGDLIANEAIEGPVADLLRAACYDCHSMETKYPWYTKVSPVNGVIFQHINEGREELNFSEWTSMPKRTQIRKLKEVAEELEEGEMPLASYTWIHSEAKLTDEQRQSLISWAESLSNSILSE